MEIQLLGELTVKREGVDCALPQSRKTRALLAYLVATARPHRRERLCDLLWDVTEDPRAALRWSLSKLRSLVDTPDIARIRADRDTVEFLCSGVHVDLIDARTRIGDRPEAHPSEVLRQIAAAFQGEFLEGLDLPDFHTYQAWCIAERERARTLHLRILETLVQRLQSEPHAALEPALERVRVDPLSESARADLIGLLAAAGRMREAEQHYQAAGRLFSEHGYQSSGELLAVWRRIRAPTARSAQPRTNTSAVPVQVTETPPPTAEAEFVGREAERARARAALADARTTNRLRLFVITGETGIGRSRLLRQIVDDARTEGARVLTAVGAELFAEHPYGAWIAALRGVDRTTIPSAVQAALAPLLVAGAVADDAARDVMHATVVQWLQHGARAGAGMLVAFDDAQWLDAASILLLRFLVEQPDAGPILVVLTLPIQAQAQAGPLKSTLSRLLRQGRVDWVALGPLSGEAVRVLAANHGMAAAGTRILRDSGGNPLLAIEIARGLQRGDTAASSLTQLVGERLARLPPEAADLARWAAVYGIQLDPQRLASVVSLTAAQLDAALADLEAQAVLRPIAGTGRYEFSHAIDQRVLYHGISDPRRRLMHRRLAEVLASAGASAFEIARHAGLAGDAVAAARACVEAALRCLRVCANTEALQFARRGMRYAERTTGVDSVKLHLDLANAYLLARRPDDLRRAAARIEPYAVQALELGLLDHARLGFKMMAWLRWEVGAWRDAQKDLRSLEAVGRSGTAAERAQALGEVARCLAILERDLPHAEALLLEARAWAAEAGVELSCIADASGMLIGYRGEVEPAMREFEHARVLARNAGNRHDEFTAVYHIILGELVRENITRARELCEELRQLGDRFREGSEAPFAAALVAVVDYASGDGEAQSRLESALVVLRRADAKHRLAFILTRAAEFELRSGANALAYAHAVEALENLDAMGGRPSETTLARAAMVRAAIALGKRSAAEHAFQALRATSAADLAAYARPALAQALALNPTKMHASSTRRAGGR